jgi:hypothetical protein
VDLLELPQLNTAVYHASFYPCTLDNACHGPAPWGLSWITAMFLHGGWDHILGNMLFLAIFGKNVEDVFGSLLYLVFYFAGGFAAMMTQAAMTLLFCTAAEARVPELGASGAIAAVLGAYFVLYPGSRIRTWIFPIFSGPNPGLDLPRAVVLVPAHRSELRAVQRLGERGRRGVLRPRRRVHLRPASSTAPRPGGTGSIRGATAFHGVGTGPLAATAKPDARGGDVHRHRIGYSQSCYNLSAVTIGSLRWMLSNDRQATAAVGK